MFYNVYRLIFSFHNIIKIQKDITEKVLLFVLHGLATIDDGKSSLDGLTIKDASDR